jgi:hypothetical protein
MTQGSREGFSAMQKTDIWCRWRAGQSLHMIGRAFGKPHTSIHCLLSHHGGIHPLARRRSLLALTLAEREDISRGIASGSSIREIRERECALFPGNQARKCTGSTWSISVLTLNFSGNGRRDDRSLIYDAPTNLGWKFCRARDRTHNQSRLGYLFVLGSNCYCFPVRACCVF